MKAKAVLKENKKSSKKANAVLKKFRMSPRKARLVVDMIRGMNVLSAIRLLKYDVRKAAGPVGKLLASSIANWRNKNNRESSELYISEIRVDGGGMIKRIKPAPQGRAHRIRKRYNHISVVIDEKKDTTTKNNLKPLNKLKKTKQQQLAPKISVTTNNKKIDSKDNTLLKEDKANSNLNLDNSANLGNVKNESAKKSDTETKKEVKSLKDIENNENKNIVDDLKVGEGDKNKTGTIGATEATGTSETVVTTKSDKKVDLDKTTSSKKDGK